jgi:hypothetical protein
MLRSTILLAIVLTVSSIATFNRVVLIDPAALCLDGTLVAYYINQGDPNKVLISFEGGGWCYGLDLSSTIEDCFQRSNTDLVSSGKYPSTFNQSEGILSDNSQNYFKDWTKIYLKYCTGTGHQGFRSSPVSYKGRDLYFRGHNVTIGQLNEL